MAGKRTLISSGSEWEKLAGYSKAVRVGNIVEVAGTVSLDEHNQIVGVNDISMQTRFILEKISKSLEQAGGKLTDVVRTRIFTTDISKFEDITKVHGEFFRDIRPACTLVEVSALVKKEFLIEIEVTAIIQ